MTVKPAPQLSVAASQQVIVQGEAAAAFEATSNLAASELSWYQINGDQVSLVGQGASYTPTETSPGNYTYQVQGQSPGFDPVSAQVTLTIVPKLKDNEVTPVDITVVEGAVPVLSLEGQLPAGVTVTGWQQLSPSTTSWTDIPNSAFEQLTLPAARLADSGTKYQALLSQTLSGKELSAHSGSATLTVVKKLVVETQPQAPLAGVLEGGTLTFTVSSNYPQARVQWQLQGANGQWENIDGATTTTYQRVVGAEDNGAKFRAVFTTDSPQQSVISSVVTVQVQPKLAISTQPSDVSTIVGNDVTFRVEANLDQVTYQWQSSVDGSEQNFKDLSGATAASFTVSQAVAGSKAKYRVVVSHGQGDLAQQVVSDQVGYQLVERLSVTEDPQSLTVKQGEQVTLAGQFNLDTRLSYQWQRLDVGQTQWVNIAGATQAELSFNASLEDNGTQFRLEARSSEPAQVQVSQAATLTVYPKLVISAHPSSLTVVAGQQASFAVETNGSVQWQQLAAGSEQWTDLAGETGAQLVVPASAENSDTSYRAAVTGPGGQQLTSRSASLTVVPKLESATLAVEGQATVTAGQSVTLHLSANPALGSEDNDPHVAQWEYSKDGGETWAKGNDSSAAQLALQTSAEMDGWQIRVLVVSGAGQQVYSNAVELDVQSAPVIMAPEQASGGSGTEADPYLIPVQLDQDLELTLQVSANPAAQDFTWEALTAGKWRQISLNGSSANSGQPVVASAPVLALAASELSDGMGLRLSASNQLGTAQAYFKVKLVTVVEDLPTAAGENAISFQEASGQSADASVQGATAKTAAGGEKSSVAKKNRADALAKTGPVWSAFGSLAVGFLAFGVATVICRRRRWRA